MFDGIIENENRIEKSNVKFVLDHPVLTQLKTGDKGNLVKIQNDPVTVIRYVSLRRHWEATGKARRINRDKSGNLLNKVLTITSREKGN